MTQEFLLKYKEALGQKQYTEGFGKGVVVSSSSCWVLRVRSPETRAFFVMRIFMIGGHHSQEVFF